MKAVSGLGDVEQALLSEIDAYFHGKAFLTLQEICQALGCSENVVYNWLKRADPTRRPPKIKLGQETRFPKLAFVRWLAKEQG
jgi:predicted DNA-binding transcriptional regulator AlpA